MRNKIFLFIAGMIFIYSGNLKSQIENVPLEESVYGFLRNMSVKKVIGSINDDVPNLSKGQITNFLNQIDASKNELSNVDRQLLEKYRRKYDYSYMNNSNSYQLIQSKYGFRGETSDIFSDKEKYIYTFRDQGSSLFFNFINNTRYATMLKPDSKKSIRLFDFGIYADGTLFDKLGYSFGVVKGGTIGDGDFAEIVDPRLRYNFKFIENLEGESIRSYDFATGYLKYETKPYDNMRLSVQLGREKTTYGLGYSNSLVFSGQHADMDFIKFNFQYGIVNFSSITASTVGRWNRNIDSTYTKYVAMNRLKVSIPDLFDLGIGEVIIYARPLELAYLNPVLFYKFAEMSLQDRDNGAIFFDIQTHFIKGLQLQATYFMDENILSDPFNFSKAINKTAMQFGAYAYEPFGLRNLSMFAEYTFIRPYVYSHRTMRADYTSWDEIIGNNIGPNADQIMLNAEYYFTDKIKLGVRLSHTRKGENEYDEFGNLIKNVGGDVFVPYTEGVDPDDAPFLDGIRINREDILLTLQTEPIRNFKFEVFYNYHLKNYLSESKKSDRSFIGLKFNLDF